MKPLFKNVARCLLVTAALATTSAAQAYFVRPLVQLGGSTIDGYLADGPTQSSQHFTSALQSRVDLRDGTVGTFLQVTGPSALAQSAGIFGDTLHFNTNAIGAPLTFSFAVDGHIQSPAVDPNLNSFLQIGVSAGIAIYSATAGATYQNFTSLSGALARDSFFTQFNNPQEVLDFDFNRLLNASVLLAADSLDVDVFAYLSIITSTNDNPVTVTMDFLHTGQFGIEAAPGVTFTSDSGAFLQAPPPANDVPEPGSLALLGVALTTVALASRRRPHGSSARDA